MEFLKLLIFSQQLISPKLLYLGNPEDLRDGVGDIFARKVIQIPISPKLLYLGNPEDLRDGVGDNLETVFESEQI